MKPVFVFDMDGVLIDSVPLMYDEVYAGFLGEFGIQGTREEFSKKVNGPKIEDIVVILKEIHNLPGTPAELLARYDRRMKMAYEKSPLTQGTREIMQELRKRGYTIAVASASKMENIAFILEKHRLAEFVDAIVSGDDVLHAKPAPDIYLKVRTALPGVRHIVLEDSDNGMRAASAAGMEVIFFNPGRRASSAPHEREISALGELPAILDADRSPMIAHAKTILFQETPASVPSPAQNAEVSRIWNEALAKNPKLFDGNVISYAGHEQRNGALTVRYFITSYRYVLARMHRPDLQLPVSPLAVSGLVLDPAKKTLVAQRAQNVTQYPGWLELVPSGGISAEKASNGTVAFKEHLAQEFREETGLDESGISAIEPLGLVHEKDYGVYVIACLVRLNSPLTNSMQGDEYKSIRVLPLAQLQDTLAKNQTVPTSKTIANEVLARRPQH
jgi:HAD superfamily hydrolase (TIGR01509 family)